MTPFPTRRASLPVAAAALLLAAACSLPGVPSAPQPAGPAAPAAPAAPVGPPAAPPAAPAPVAPPAAAPVAPSAPSAAGARLVAGPVGLPPDVTAGTHPHRGRPVSDFGALPDDGVDDTAALQRALDDQRIVDGRPVGESPDDYNGLNRTLFLAPGTYDLSDRIGWTGCCLTVRGAGSGSTTLKLRDGAAGFADPAARRPVLETEATNEAFRNNVLGLTVDTGSGNPGAVGVSYIASNHGVMRDVLVRSGDGAGVVGVDMTRKWPGPLLLQDVAVEGFDVGIDVAEPYHVTMERITLRGQREAGLRCSSTQLAVRQLLSDNAVPVLRAEREGYRDLCTLTLLDSELRGGAAGTAALDLTATNTVLARDVTTEGYAAAVRIDGADATGPDVAEYTNRATSADGGPATTLRLPVEEVPTAVDPDPATWARAYAPEYNSRGDEIAAAFAAGSPTVYFTSEPYLLYNELEVVVPAGVTHVNGYGATINSDPNGVGGGGLTLVVEDGDAPLIVEGFGYGVRVEVRSDRTVVLRDGKYEVSSAPEAAGQLFFENVEVHGFTLRAGQQLWARQWNNELQGDKIVNEGGDLWLFGMKTERFSTVLSATGGRSELLGLLLYPAQSDGDQSQPAFEVVDGQFAAFYTTNVFEGDRSDEYLVHLRRTRAGVVEDVVPAELPLAYERVGLVTG